MRKFDKNMDQLNKKLIEYFWYGAPKETIEDKFGECRTKDYEDKKTTKDVCIIAVNDNGDYFGLVERQHTTTPFITKDPLEAKKISIYNEDISNLKPAPYYFENSDRMRYWLEGFYMVAIEIETITTWNMLK